MATSDREVGGSSTTKPTHKQRWPDEVVRYLHLVKRTFENEPKKYHEFLQILVAHRHRRVSITCLIARVRALLKEHENMIDEFYQYLPERHRVVHNSKDFLVKIKAKNLFKGHPDLIEEYQRYLPGSVILPQSQPTDKKVQSPRLRLSCDGVEDSLGYLRRVKERFQDQQERYDEFLTIMKDFKSQRIDRLRLAVAVRVLLRGNPDLIQGFNLFLPEEYWLDGEKALDFDQAADLIIKIKNGLEHDGTLIWPFVKVLYRYYKEGSMTLQDFYREVKVLLKNYPNLLEELMPFSSDLDSGGTSPK